MSLPHRIAGGAIVVRHGRILLVRYTPPGGESFLVAPGGGVLEHESVADAAVRETLEETGLHVAARNVVLVEDVLASRFKMIKVWFACDVVGGEVGATEGARLEAIVEARWFARRELDGETVYPYIVKERDWATFDPAAGAVAEVSPPRRARF